MLSIVTAAAVVVVSPAGGGAAAAAMAAAGVLVYSQCGCRSGLARRRWQLVAATGAQRCSPIAS